jgi:hypothetical protein
MSGYEIGGEMLLDKTDKMIAIEALAGCSIEQYLDQKTAQGLSIPKIAATIKEETGIRVTAECLRDWIDKLGGRTRIEFPARETAAV